LLSDREESAAIERPFRDDNSQMDWDAFYADIRAGRPKLKDSLSVAVDQKLFEKREDPSIPKVVLLEQTVTHRVADALGRIANRPLVVDQAVRVGIASMLAPYIREGGFD